MKRQIVPMDRLAVHFCDSPAFGGAEQALLTLLGGLDRAVWRPTLLHYTGPGIEPLVKGAHALDVEVRAVPPAIGPAGLRRIPFLVRTLRELRPAVFHAHQTWALSCELPLAAAALAGVPAVIATAQLFVELPWNGTHRLRHRMVAQGVDRYIAVSHDVANRLHATFGVPYRKLDVVHNAVPVDQFRRPSSPALRAQLTGGRERPVVLTVARLDAQKGLPYLLEAAARVPEAVFVLVGEGPERATLEAQRRRLGLEERVVLPSFREDIPDLLAASDLFVLPSLYEGLPLALLEAMAACKPVVATEIAGVDEVVTSGETGLLVPPANATALAGAISALLADRDRAERLAVAGFRHVRLGFSAESMVRGVTAIYDDVLNGSR